MIILFQAPERIFNTKFICEKYLFVIIEKYILKILMTEIRFGMLVLGMFDLEFVDIKLKRALDKCNIIPKQESWDFYTIRSVGISNDCMPSFAFYIDFLLKN